MVALRDLLRSRDSKVLAFALTNADSLHLILDHFLKQDLLVRIFLRVEPERVHG